LREDIQGDLHELFYLRVEREGLRRARLRYWFDVIRFFRPYVLRRQPLPYQHARGPIMLKNYLKIAFRNLRRQPGYAFINIGGLAVGLAVCLLILLYVQDELAFDAFHEKSDRIARVLTVKPSPDLGDQTSAVVPPPVGEALVEAFPEVEATVRFDVFGRNTVVRGPNRFYVGDYLITEPSFFEVFGFEMLQGDPATALVEPRTVVLTQETAHRYFGDEDPMGKTLSVEAQVFGDMTVTGILADLPSTSHLQFSMLFSFASLNELSGWHDYLANWETGGGMYTYVLLKDGASAASLEPKLADFLDRHRTEEVQITQLHLQPLRDIHFDSAHVLNEANANKGNIAYLYIFSAIALFILLIACINYMNMATARSMRRAKEVGLRKVVGAHRLQLIRQFLSESMLTAGMGLVLAMGLVVVLLPSFNALAGKDLALNLTQNWPFLVSLAGLALLVGLISGSYPALFLSRFQPAQVLKGTEAATGAARLRRGLVVTQFTLSIAMMVATLVVYNQMQYVQQKNLGFDQDHLVVIDINNGDVRRDFETVKAAFAAVPSVQRVSTSSRVPGEWKNLTQIEAQAEGAAATNLTTMYFFGVDEDFLDTYDIDVADGRGFASDFTTDSLSVLLNATAAQQLGLAVGDRLRVPGSSLAGRFQETEFLPRVVGIVQDFHVRSLHEAIGPVVLGYHNNPINVIDYFTARIDGRDVPGTIARLRAVGEQFDPSHPFEYNFLDERLADFYERETRLATLFAIAAILAVVIACLGLFGLASFTAEQRTKEIGVRKVLGASVPGIMLLLSKDFVKLVGIAFVIAAPLAYFAMHRWLADFAYRIEISWWIFLMAGLTALGIALLTVSYQSIRAAMADPVKSLRYE
jgi:putative ABC transport system permease protein